MPRDISRHLSERNFLYNTNVCVSVLVTKKLDADNTDK